MRSAQRRSPAPRLVKRGLIYPCKPYALDNQASYICIFWALVFCGLPCASRPPPPASRARRHSAGAHSAARPSREPGAARPLAARPCPALFRWLASTRAPTTRRRPLCPPTPAGGSGWLRALQAAPAALGNASRAVNKIQ